MLSILVKLAFVLILSTIPNAYGNILVLPTTGRYIEEVFRDIPANFGPELPYADLRGMLVYAEPAYACTPIEPPPITQENHTGNWIVLVSRKNCSFEQKIRIAQQAGYHAIIVHNVGSEELETMDANNATGINIPSVFVAESSGIIMKQMYADRDDYFLIINREEPFNINMNLLLPFAIVVGICFIVMIIFMIVKCIKDRRRQRRHRLPSSTLNKIPVHKFTKGDPYDTCAICLEDYLENEKLRVLPCAHAYHCKCIDPWLTKNRRVCPVCKRKVFAQDETPYNDTDSDSDADDRTPLVNPASRTTQGGTFEEQSENPFQRAARSVSQQISDDVHFVTTSGHHSINAEHTDDTSSDGSEHFLVPGGSSQYSEEACSEADEVHTHTRPGTSNDEKRDVIV